VLRACCCAGSLKPRPLTGSCVHVAAYVQKHRLSCMSSVCQGVVSKCAPVDAPYFTGGRSRPAFRRLIRPLGGAMPPKDAADAAPAKRGDTSFSRVQGDWWQKITRDEIRARAPHAAHLTAAGPERWQQFAEVRAREEAEPEPVARPAAIGGGGASSSSAPASMLQETVGEASPSLDQMARDYMEICFDMASTPANFHPERHTIMVLGRPIQVPSEPTCPKCIADRTGAHRFYALVQVWSYSETRVFQPGRVRRCSPWHT
jgi:hypothetical protein